MKRSNGKSARETLDVPTDVDEIDLLELEQAEGPMIVLPNRRKVRIHLFDGEHYQLYEKTQSETDLVKAEKQGLKLLKFAIPDITMAEIRSLSPLMVHFIGKAAARQAEGYLALLRKNVERPVSPALADVSKPQPSTRKTKPSTSSRASRGRSGIQAASGL